MRAHARDGVDTTTTTVMVMVVVMIEASCVCSHDTGSGFHNIAHGYRFYRALCCPAHMYHVSTVCAELPTINIPYDKLLAFL